ncbi:MAG: hypothetical protein IPI45_06885 [Saprospiraceae bacterium]|nr:hypothetical protein [Saprospiraceae bacterium]
MQEKLKHISYLVSHGFAARMLMQTNLLGLLRKQGYPVSLISPDAQDPNLMDYCSLHGIQLIEFKPQSWIWKTNYMLYRMYFLEDIKSNPALYEKHYHETRLAKHRFWILKYLPYVLICFYYVFRSFPFLRRWYWKFEQQLLNSKQALSMLQENNPDLILATYPVNPAEGILLHNAKKLKIKTAIHLLSWDNITCKGHFLALADYYLAWGPVMKNEFIEKYQIPENKIYLCGVPHFDIHTETKKQAVRTDLLRALNIDPNKPWIVFGMSSPRFAPREIDIVEYLAKKIIENAFGETMQLVIRPHPQNVKGWMADPEWIRRLESLKNHRILLFYPEMSESSLLWSMDQTDFQKLSTVLSACVVCINSCSTLSMDALMAGKGNIAPMFDGDASYNYWHSARRLLDYTHIKKFVALGGTQVVSDFASLDSEILNFIRIPNYKLTERNHSIQQEFYFNGPSSTQTCLSAIGAIALLNKNESNEL